MYGLADLIAVGLSCLVAGFGLAVAVTLPALKKSAKELEQVEAELMVFRTMQQSSGNSLANATPSKGG